MVSAFRNRALCREVVQTRLDYSYRNMKGEDIDRVSQLCADIFEGPFNALQFIQKASATSNFKTQLLDRYNNYVLMGAKHSMVVCIDEASADDIIGFVEIGMLPRPANVQKKAKEDIVVSSSLDDRAEVASDISKAISEAMTEMEEEEENESYVGSADEAPYLGNVAVSRDYRRKGIGSRLVRVGMKVCEKWNERDLFVAVDASNRDALLMYNKMNFDQVLDERNLIYGSRKEPRVFLKKEL